MRIRGYHVAQVFSTAGGSATPAAWRYWPRCAGLHREWLCYGRARSILTCIRKPSRLQIRRKSFGQLDSKRTSSTVFASSGTPASSSISRSTGKSMSVLSHLIDVLRNELYVWHPNQMGPAPVSPFAGYFDKWIPKTIFAAPRSSSPKGGASYNNRKAA